MGYTTSYWHAAKPNIIKYSNLVESLVLMFIDIGAYSNGINEEQVDHDLDSTFFESLQKLYMMQMVKQIPSQKHLLNY